MSFDLRHLSRRFFEVVKAQGLAPIEQDRVAALLVQQEQSLFFQQGVADQRHAYEVMQRASSRTDDPVVLRAALLHDVGKTHGDIGVIPRVIATILDALRVPLRGRMAVYRNHGPLGADLLAAVGAPTLAVDFARRHPDPDPGPHQASHWEILLDADDL